MYYFEVLLFCQFSYTVYIVSKVGTCAYTALVHFSMVPTRDYCTEVDMT